MNTSIIDVYLPHFPILSDKEVKVLTIPNEYGNGELLFFTSLSGFEVIVSSFNFMKPYCFPFHWSNQLIELVIPLKGQREVQMQDKIMLVPCDNSYLNYLQEFEGEAYLNTGDFLSISICIPIKWYENWVQKQGFSSLQFHEMIQQQMISRLENPITASLIRQAKHIKQLLFQPRIDELKIEVAILQLIDMYFTQQFKMLRSIGTLRADEVKKIQLAQDILVNLMDNPPSIAVLANQIELNEQKLKQGFKEVYGQTPYKHLKDVRMQRAYYYITERHMSVTETALTVGYQNISYFSQLFYEYFGVNPSQCLKEK
ncbi:helix-turn-helix transcriptional regulator [Lysinibacillus sp. NPDC056185]|uniref:helix-turn-helix transcriptional regulator n=1 Tax=Lysinibacillus sp. NPDC056185 TaxID=3345739 RepID=UPI0039EF869F